MCVRLYVFCYVCICVLFVYFDRRFCWLTSVYFVCCDCLLYCVCSVLYVERCVFLPSVACFLCFVFIEFVVLFMFVLYVVCMFSVFMRVRARFLFIYVCM